MAIASQVMGGGVSAGMARAIMGSVATGLSGAGTTLATGTAITAAFNVFTTVASGTGGTLPSCVPGDSVWVFNNTGTNALTVYPDSGSTINQLSASTGVLLAPYTGAIFARVSSTGWLANLSA